MIIEQLDALPPSLPLLNNLKVHPDDSSSTSLKVLDWDWNQPQPLSSLPGDTLLFAAMTENRQIAGLLALDPRHGQIVLFCVSERTHDAGISVSLLRAAEQAAKRQRCFQLEAAVLLSSVPFFLKEGYELVRQSESRASLPGRFLMRRSLKLHLVIAAETWKTGRTALDLARLVQQALPQTKIAACDLSDGQNGFVEALILQSAYQRIRIRLSDESEVSYAIRGNNAVLQLNRHGPADSSRFAAEIIQDALRRGCRRFYLTLSSQSPHDGGQGLLEGLGTRFIMDGPQIVAMDDSELRKRIRGLTFIGLCDTLQSLAPDEKPLSPLSEWLRFSDCRQEAGARAGHQIGLMLLSILKGKCLSASQQLIRAIGFSSRLQDADLLLLVSDRKPGRPENVSPIALVLQACRSQRIPFYLLSCESAWLSSDCTLSPDHVQILDLSRPDDELLSLLRQRIFGSHTPSSSSFSKTWR